MCIISNPVASVSNTKILVAINSSSNRQFTVYSNNVANISNNNAMILPVPYPQTVKFHDLTNYENLFDDCKKCFEFPVYESHVFTNDTLSMNIANSLEVFNVGGYQVSLAMSLNDIKRVNSNVFTLSYGCDELLTEEYNNPIFGFIICKMANNRKDYHPFGYSHNIYNNLLFIPTKHYHSHNNFLSYNNSNIENYRMFRNLMDPINKNTIVDDWAHEIYLYNATAKNNIDFINMSKNNYRWTGDNKLKLDYIDFDFGELKHFEKHKIDGHQKNIDLFATIQNSNQVLVY